MIMAPCGISATAFCILKRRPLILMSKIEFVVSEKQLGKGYGGKNEDDEYFDLNANI